MTTFTIDREYNITAYSKPPSPLAEVETFSSEKQLARLAAAWPIARLLGVWNSFAGVAPFHDLKPVRKFTNRKAAVTRIWTAIQRLPPIPELSVAAPAAAANSSSPCLTAGCEGVGTPSKGAFVMDLMRRPAGASLSEIMAATGWQRHSVRGYISGTVSKKLGLHVESSPGADGQRTYRIIG